MQPWTITFRKLAANVSVVDQRQKRHHSLGLHQKYIGEDAIIFGQRFEKLCLSATCSKDLSRKNFVAKTYCQHLRLLKIRNHTCVPSDRNSHKKEEEKNVENCSYYASKRSILRRN